MDEAILCENLQRTFTQRSLMGGKRETVALRGLNLSVPRGSVFGLLGPNGAGKTTTVRILSTLLTPTGGRACVQGFDVMKQTSQVRRSIGFVLGGDRGLYGRLTGKENLEYFAALNHVEPRLAKRRADELLEKVGLFERRDTLVEQYSRGMKQRLHIARGLLTDPEVVFMDEPTIGLDPQVAQEVRSIIPQLAAQGKTVLLTTHYMFEADVLCERLALIDHGEIVASGSPSEIKQRVSQIRVIELQLRESPAGLVDSITALPGVVGASALPDGMLTRLTVQVRPNADVRDAVLALIAEEQLESVLEREPTLEEAYLSILG
ncbi:MAG TPA: ATP-binding cassette domain-containing protein [Dehalococcoidia bacterium]|nr:ATP-binding cassette domain-containing protein [Dehalococcoidia bacterium]